LLFDPELAKSSFFAVCMEKSLQKWSLLLKVFAFKLEGRDLEKWSE
jgi:hypothetical protein